MPKKVLVSGASGPVGTALLPALERAGYSVMRLVRGTAAGEQEIAWNPLEPVSPEMVSGFDAVVHLAGETIVGRWSEAKKQRILASRKLGTGNLAQALANAPQRPRVLVSASAIGYYGDRGDEVLREQSSSGSGFAAEVARTWEAATQAAAEAGIRTVRVRIGVVMSTAGGALPMMLPPFRMGLGGKMGSGRQWYSWIHVQDLAGAILHILKNDSLQGAVNGVSPGPVTNAEFTKTLASVLRRPAIFPMPAFAARLAFGQMADELLLASQRVEPAALLGSGYQFQYPELKKALEDLVGK
ncbi:MAG TPA: TIGR01777 family oxidoreductase [Terriglobales bacterium]|nr:TIGR01777 family oxidoreductase [Terriglobales bacterium]